MEELDNLIEALGEQGGHDRFYSKFKDYQDSEFDKYTMLDLHEDAINLFRSTCDKKIKKAAAALALAL